MQELSIRIARALVPDPAAVRPKIRGPIQLMPVKGSVALQQDQSSAAELAFIVRFPTRVVGTYTVRIWCGKRWLDKEFPVVVKAPAAPAAQAAPAARPSSKSGRRLKTSNGVVDTMTPTPLTADNLARVSFTARPSSEIISGRGRIHALTAEDGVRTARPRSAAHIRPPQPCAVCDVPGDVVISGQAFCDEHLADNMLNNAASPLYNLPVMAVTAALDGLRQCPSYSTTVYTVPRAVAEPVFLSALEVGLGAVASEYARKVALSEFARHKRVQPDISELLLLTKLAAAFSLLQVPVAMAGDDGGLHYPPNDFDDLFGGVPLSLQQVVREHARDRAGAPPSSTTSEAPRKKNTAKPPAVAVMPATLASLFADAPDVPEKRKKKKKAKDREKDASKKDRGSPRLRGSGGSDDGKQPWQAPGDGSAGWSGWNMY